MQGALEDAWQAALAAEQRAAFGYGLLGAHLHGSPQLPLAISCSDAHESLRNATEQAIAAAGLTPVAPAADYPDLYPVNTAAQAEALALRLEDDCAAAWRYLYATTANTTGTPAETLRDAALNALIATAVRATQWRKVTNPSAATVAFPGL
ncbi:MAG TPA: DUF4439 domain-containing protein [Jatrophihabitantaceae bacterium]|nr:DUF4439 domain-containing protein [Jatrophihabitantaceae bacterium]